MLRKNSLFCGAKSLGFADEFQPGRTMADKQPVMIKKYANRRLYHTGSSSYVTLEDLAGMVKKGEDFVVRDAKSNEDITRPVLAQIIFEQESRAGQNLMPIAFLRQLIGFYGDSLQALVPSYLQMSIDRFAGERVAVGEAASRAFGPTGASAIEELSRRNMQMFTQALGIFSPFPAARARAEDAAPEREEDPKLKAMRAELDEMRRKLDSIAARK